jgi:hypothetical protein
MIKNLPQLVSPRIVCLCGSTKYLSAFETANRDFTLAGYIVLSIGVDLKFRDLDYIESIHSKEEREMIKDRLDRLHKAKIRLADEVFILNYNGEHVGVSTRSEVLLAHSLGKVIEWLEPDKIQDDLKHCIRSRSTFLARAVRPMNEKEEEAWREMCAEIYRERDEQKRLEFPE